MESTLDYVQKPNILNSFTKQICVINFSSRPFVGTAK